MNQNLSSYWIFYTVANAGNISKAAAQLGILRQNLQHRMKKLGVHP